MDTSNILVQTAMILSFVVSALIIVVGRRVAQNIGLVDKPNERKKHIGDTPLLGGVAIFSSMILLTPLVISDTSMIVIVFLSILIAIMGLADDLYDLSAKIRFLVQFSAGVCLAVFGDVRIIDLGNVFGFGEFQLDGLGSILFTAFCVVGVINAMNMIDGIDGLFGTMAAMTLGTIAYFAHLSGLIDALAVCLISVGGLLAFLSFNLGMFGANRNIFAGDSGSTAIGFLVAALLIFTTQDSNSTLTPVAAGWIVGLPLLDTVTVMARRMMHGCSPFEPGRDHFHHHLIDSGLSNRQSLLTIVMIQLCFMGVGIASNFGLIQVHVSFWGFVFVTVMHFVFTPRIITHLNTKTQNSFE